MQPRTRRFKVVLPVLAVLALQLAPFASAQSWIGGASLGVQVRGGNGALEGARVEIRYRGPGGESGGPAPRSTDGGGQASFTGLAEGVWSLEISHPDHLSFIATLSLRRGKKAEATTCNAISVGLEFEF